MAMSKNLGMYADVQEIFDQILERGKTCSIPFPSASKAMHWRTRAYYYRKLLHDAQAKAVGDDRAVTTSTPYDMFIFKIDKGAPTVVRVESAYKPDNIIFDDDAVAGIFSKIETPDHAADEDAFAAAAAMLKDLDLEE